MFTLETIVIVRTDVKIWEMKLWVALEVHLTSIFLSPGLQEADKLHLLPPEVKIRLDRVSSSRLAYSLYE